MVKIFKSAKHKKIWQTTVLIGFGVIILIGLIGRSLGYKEEMESDAFQSVFIWIGLPFVCFYIWGHHFINWFVKD